MAARKETFFLVWADGGKSPTFRHTNMRSAQIEADRLARLDPGVEFIVVEAKTGHLSPKPALELTLYDEIPF